MEIDFKKKKKVSEEEIAEKGESKEYEDDAQAYYKRLRLRMEAEKKSKDADKKRLSEEEQKKRKERESYCNEIKAIYREKAKKKA